MYPTAEGERVPVDIVEHVVLVRIHHPHIMSVAGLHPICFGDIVDYDLHGRITVFIFAHPVDDKVAVTTVDTVLITVYHQAVVIGISLQIAVLHIVVVIDPLHRNTVGRHRTQDIRITVTIQVYIGRLIPCGSRWQPIRDQEGICIPIFLFPGTVRLCGKSLCAQQQGACCQQ